MPRKKKLTPEEEIAQKEAMKVVLLMRELDELIIHHKIPDPPASRTYSIGDRVQWGAHDKSIVVEVSEDKRFYKLETTGAKTNSRDNGPYHQFNWQDWTNLLPYTTIQEHKSREVFSKKDDVYLKQYNSTINSFFSMVYRFGVDFDVEYQRGYVWSLEDKVLLIDSIMNNVEIGKFLFVKREWAELITKEMYGYEILDGKQRLSTIMEFYESRFQYKGKYYHELSRVDQYKFEEYSIAYMEAENLSEQDRIKLFIRFNTTGKVMDKEHIEKVKLLLK